MRGCYINRSNSIVAIPGGARSKTWDLDRPFAEIAGSNLSGYLPLVSGVFCQVDTSATG